MYFQIVVARYNEDMNYLIPFSNVVIIYNKGEQNIPHEFKNVINLPNIGRETHTYLYHIITNYNNLAENTMFIQGHIGDHRMLDFKEYLKNKSFTGKISNNPITILKTHINHRGKFLRDLKSGNLKRPIYTSYDFINNILGINIENQKSIDVVWGANFSVSRQLILNKSINFYKNTIKYVEYDSNPEEGHFMERAWYLIFNHLKFVEKSIILYYFSININDINVLINLNKMKSLNEIEIRDKINKSKEIHLWTLNPLILKLLNLRDVQIKYINSLNYVEIYPYINDNSINIKFNNPIFILIEFANDIYELQFYNNNVQIYHYNTDKIIISGHYKKKRLNNHFLIKWTNDEFIIDGILQFPIRLFDNMKINRIMIKGESFIDYNIKIINNISIFITKDENIINNFYLNHYHNYYTINYNDY